MTASSPRLTCVRPLLTTWSRGSGAASHSLMARSMFPACTSLRICAMNSAALTRYLVRMKTKRSPMTASAKASTAMLMNEKGAPSTSACQTSSISRGSSGVQTVARGVPQADARSATNTAPRGPGGARPRRAPVPGGADRWNPLKSLALSACAEKMEGKLADRRRGCQSNTRPVASGPGRGRTGGGKKRTAEGTGRAPRTLTGYPARPVAGAGSTPDPESPPAGLIVIDLWVRAGIIGPRLSATPDIVHHFGEIREINPAHGPSP